MKKIICVLFFRTVKNLSAFFMVTFFFNLSHSQGEENLIKYTYLDSLNQLYYGKSSEEAYISHHKILRESSKLSYRKGTLSAYKSLMWYHGTSNTTYLDSVLYYADLFETNVKIEDNKNNIELIDFLELPEYYLNKGQLLSSGFGLPEQGLESYFEAYPLIPEDDVQLNISYSIAISQIYFYKFQYNKSLEVLEPLLKDTIGQKPYLKIRLLQQIALNYVKKEMPEKSYLLHKEVLRIAKNNNNKTVIWWTKDLLAHDYFRLGEHQKAIDSALSVRNYCVKNNMSSILYNNTSHLSTYYNAVGNINKAIQYREEALALSKGAEYENSAYLRLAEYYTTKKQYTKAINMYKKSKVSVDSLRSKEKKTLITHIDANLKFIKEKQKSQQILFDIEMLEEKNKKQKLYFFTISITLMSLVLLMGFVLIFRKYQKGEKVIEVLKSNEKKLLEEKIVLRENELEASAIAQSRRLETLTSIKNELEQIKVPHITKLEEAKQMINNLIKSASDMFIITKRIDSEYPTIASKLKNKYPTLTDTQMRYCLLTKLNLSIKETAIILSVTPDTVKVARSRLKKKLGIPPEMPIKVFLDALSKEE